MSDTPVSPVHIGTFLSSGSPAVAELAGESGFDWILVDLEHGCESESELPTQLRALRGSKAKIIVRVGAATVESVGRVLDWGADGIMVPRINSVQEAFQCIRAAHYPPLGKRGFSRTVRAYGYGLRPPGDHPPAPIIIAQIETLEGVEHASEIAAVSGIDALFVGPADLQFDLTAHHSARSFDECLDRVSKAALDHKKGAGILVRNTADLPKLRATGFTWLAMSSDLALLREGFASQIAEAK
jgi:2-dehydro-3-deoxyglucarate aldolase/4-hydroxy-2-oxoheptanedioate aldolase